VRAQPGLAPLILAAGLCLSDAIGQSRPQPSPPSRPASQPASSGVRPFQRGVAIDWTQPAVYVEGRVVLRRGPLEYLACFPGKEHESIVLLEAAATHIYLALGLIGLEPGHPPQWDEQRGRFGPPTGDLVDVGVEWDEGGQRRTAFGFQWLHEYEYARQPIDRPWVFAGAQRLPDGTLSADHTGDGLALVDKPDSLLALSRSHVSRNAELWVGANTSEIPPLDAPVRVVLRPARRRAHEIRVDFRGAAFVDGRYARREDVVDLIRLAHRLSPDSVQTVVLDDTLRSDVARLRDVLAAANVAARAVRLVRPASAPSPTSRPAR
jgi:hypothetical protein